jgi:hypothetical protein
LNAKYNPNVLIPAKIKSALKTLGENALPSEEFRKLTGISSLQLASFSSQFEEYHIPVREGGRIKVLWAGTTAFAAKAREALES